MDPEISLANRVIEFARITVLTLVESLHPILLPSIHVIDN